MSNCATDSCIVFHQWIEYFGGNCPYNNYDENQMYLGVVHPCDKDQEEAVCEDSCKESSRTW